MLFRSVYNGDTENGAVLLGQSIGVIDSIDDVNDIIERIIKAVEVLPSVKAPQYLLETIARMSIYLRVDGHRPDIIILKSSKTLAAYNGRVEVTPDDVLTCSIFALGHRTRNLGMEEPAMREQIKESFGRALKEAKIKQK